MKHKVLLPALFFLLTWLWAAWWMGDVMRVAYERSFFAANATLMHWLWQQAFGSLWILGRALLTLYHWPLMGGLMVATLLTAGSGLVGYCLRLPQRWRWMQYLPAAAWMTWTAWAGMDLYYMHEPGRILGLPLLLVIVCAADAFVIWTFKRKKRTGPVSAADMAAKAEPTGKSGMTARSARKTNMAGLAGMVALLLLCFGIPVLLLQQRHPYLRPLTRMQVQLLHQDYQGMVDTGHEHAELSYRHLAAYYAIGLARTGRLTDQFFDIRLEYDSVYSHHYSGEPDHALNYYLADCDYQSGLVRPAMHRAMEELTMDGPSLFTLKHLARMALLESDWNVARKYLHIIRQAPFEGDFLAKYEPMLDRPELVAADPEFASVMRTAPLADAFENQFEKPCFLGYFAVIGGGRSREALNYSLMANLYSKRMPAFLMRCQPLVGTTPPRSIAEGLLTQSPKNEGILQAFPQLQMDMQRYTGFLQVAAPYMKERERGGKELFERYRGYYPYYYYFGNIRATRKATPEHESSSAGVN